MAGAQPRPAHGEGLLKEGVCIGHAAKWKASGRLPQPRSSVFLPFWTGSGNSLEILCGMGDNARMEMAKALVYADYGKPHEVLRLEERPVGEPGPGEVKLRVLAAPVHPSDFGMILGNYGRLAELPAVAGRS